jgi:NAD(P)-dependent dehydrogenase (short-subunit alcohol dehydrogenase family)
MAPRPSSPYVCGVFSLNDRTAIVTGASGGLGERFARVLHEAGAHVIGAARRADRLSALAEELDRFTAVPCDVSDDADLAGLVDATVADHDRVDILVNNAGISDAQDPAETEDPDRFRSVVDVNLNAAFVLSTLCARFMLEAGAGSIVNISSVHGLVAASPNKQAAYVASKSGLIGLTRELACQWATRGVRVNALAPGYFASELTEEMFAAESGMKWITRNTPMRRPGEPHELDGALLFLASDASTYVTGQVVAVDGGFTAR